MHFDFIKNKDSMSSKNLAVLQLKGSLKVSCSMYLF